MAEFLIAYNKTSANEGGYSNDPADRGGETWKGIARNMHPNWPGWKLIDGFRNSKLSRFPANLKKSAELETQVKSFYKANFWHPIKGDQIKEQVVADSLYDSAVNMGVSQAIKLAQRALELPATGVMDGEILNKLA